MPRSQLTTHPEEDRLTGGLGIAEQLRQELPHVLFIEDLARLLGTSTSTIRRALRAHTFPIPMLPSIDRKQRWGREAVLRFLRNETRGGLR